MSATQVGLRVDVDTFRGTRDGVPSLVEAFQKHTITASFYMSVGPDNMGRNLWRLLKPQFFLKMLRSNAANLYGYDILLRGTAWPGPMIGDKLPERICMPMQAGHEMGLHAWDHYTWQAKTDTLTPAHMEKHIRLGVEKLTELLGAAPTTSAAAGWRCNEQALLLKEKFGFTYNSDCRGSSIFRPVVQGRELAPQIPVTLPTYDEIIGQNGVTDENYNERILSLCKPDRLNVYTIHAEVEGIGKRDMFDKLLAEAKLRGIDFVPLKQLLPANILAQGKIIKQEMPGREGWLAQQTA